MGIWPAALVAGVAFAVPQFLVSNFHGPWLVDIVASLCSNGGDRGAAQSLAAERALGACRREAGEHRRVPRLKTAPSHDAPNWSSCLDALGSLEPVCLRLGQYPSVKDRGTSIRVSSDQNRKLPNAVPVCTCKSSARAARGAAGRAPEKAVFTFNWLSATGTGILWRAVIRRIRSWASPSARLGARYWRNSGARPLFAPHHRRHAGAWLRDEVLRARTRPWDWRWRKPARSIRSSARCWAGWAWRSPVRILPRTFSLAACKKSPPNKPASARS